MARTSEPEPVIVKVVEQIVESDSEDEDDDEEFVAKKAAEKKKAAEDAVKKAAEVEAAKDKSGRNAHFMRFSATSSRYEEKSADHM
jgi:hypothetical protein